MILKNSFTKFVLIIGIFLHSYESSFAQEGDQILDGIGETDLIARYVFDGDLKDWSRNNLHASTYSENVEFEADERFGKVLSMTGKKGENLILPSEILSNVESLSISAWVYLRSDKSGQYLLDFSTNGKSYFAAFPTGVGGDSNFKLNIEDHKGKSKSISGDSVPLNKWVHLVFVYDIPSKAFKTYVDSKQIKETPELENELLRIFSSENLKNPTISLGGSATSEAESLDALLHDVRFYRVPLANRQVASIYFNAFRDVNQNVAHSKKVEVDLPDYPEDEAKLYNVFLSNVEDIKVETEVGSLPRLPSHVKGSYVDDLNGPLVRVIWPAPKDNELVSKEGLYTVKGKVPGTDFEPVATVSVKAKTNSSLPKQKLELFKLHQINLEEDQTGQKTKFIENRDKFLLTLAETDPNSFLYMFRHAFDQPQPENAVPLGVWDSQETKLRGHATGHYLTAIAQAYASTGYDEALQQNFLDKMDYMVNVLYDLSKLSGNKVNGKGNEDPVLVPKGPGKSDFDSDLSDEGIRSDYWNWGKGYISAYPPDQFIMLEKGATYGGQKNQIWAPYYTLHKILAGLIDIYKVSGNEKALEIAKGMGEWVYTRLDALPQETLIKMWNTYIAGEFGGMNETMATLYEITQDPRFLKGAQLFDNIQMFFGDAEYSHGLAKNVDTFRGLHANQHIPQVVGSLEMYRVSAKDEYFRVADNYWFKAVNDYMYSIGGVAGARNPANAECFIAEPATLYENGFSSGGQNETCATYNMLKLTGNLFLFEQRGELMDYFERGLYNHILASVAEDSPANTYHVPLRPGSIKHFGNAKMTGFTCCNGTSIESNTKLQQSIYYKSIEENAVYVNLFIPSTLDWEERNIKIKQATSFPKEDKTQLLVEGEGEFVLHLRVPSWARKGYHVSINGKEIQLDVKPGSYIAISRFWEDGDKVDLRMPFDFYLDPVMDQPNIASLFYGPILLAAQESDARKDWRKISFDKKDIGKSIKGNPAELTFTIDGVEFKPFYDTYGRHSVYLDVSLN
jgi:DUF1680 family protein